jgi:hypothetical protein
MLSSVNAEDFVKPKAIGIQSEEAGGSEQDDD